ncbi:MAG: hypothetical protein KDG44_07635 [Burkholderiaceae bacterium]|nr:hypothetical protein [Burkholderiaceae bacterium]
MTTEIPAIATPHRIHLLRAGQALWQIEPTALADATAPQVTNCVATVADATGTGRPM